jgi:hypothetical protein
VVNQEGSDELSAAADAELVKDRPEVLLDGIGRDPELIDDLLG